MTASFVTTHITGGLGNQMFQYAHGRALALRRVCPLFLDIEWFVRHEGGTPRKFALDVFPALAQSSHVWQKCPSAQRGKLACRPLWWKILAKIFSLKPQFKKEHVFEAEVHPYAEINYPKPAYLEGYWQDERYFLDQVKQIREDFTFPALPAAAEDMARCIKASSHAVSVHIRRGDYAHNASTQSVHGLCSAVYYTQALEHIKQYAPHAELFIFSDEPQWARENFQTIGLQATIVDLHQENDAHHDLHLMSLCKDHIIANSSFSWWGAWLGEQGTVIAPKQWFQAQNLKGCSPVPKRWITL